MSADATEGADSLADARPQRVRKPLYAAPTPAGAAPHYAHDPSPILEARYRRIWETSMHDMPFVNNALSVSAIGFRRYRDDWVGAVITPWFLNLFLLPGGGSLWSDLASGDRVRIPFPVGELEFIADYDPGGDIPAYQYCPLFAPVSQFATHAAAQAAAEEALSALFTVVEPEVGEVVAAPDLPAAAEAPAPIPARRAFFRKVAGHRS
jgi:[NiFe] hydrogenase assembly HybE family chaperone